MDPQLQKELHDLLVSSLDGRISDAQTRRLNEIMDHNVRAHQYCIDFYFLATSLKRPELYIGNNPAADPSESQQQLRDLQELARYEIAAEVVKIPQPVPTEAAIQNVKIQRKINKVPLVTTLILTAAMVLLMVWARLTPVTTSQEVATLTDSMKARWSDSTGSIYTGSRLATGYNPLTLQEGFIELLFDNNAKVVIEGPAQFSLMTADQMKLNYGKLYAVVGQSAIGFCVNTPNSRVIDLGTEFGVQADSNGSTELHVIKGKINFLAGTTNKRAMQIGQGFAKLISGSTSQVQDIPVKETDFVRSINSKNATVWRGQKQINLADIVGGGNGLGSGKIDMGIDPATGSPSNERPGTRTSANDYRSVPSNQFIDGVFVPNGRSPQIVSSQGHLFRECPSTIGSCCENINNVVRSLIAQLSLDIDVSGLPAHLLLMHANMGITFDLQELRKNLPGVNIERFQSKFGIRKWAIHPTASNADFWVLVDGEVRYVKKQVKIDSLHSIDIELTEQDRFLTLIVTDGGDPEGRILDGLVLLPNDSDWGMFADPMLILK